MALTCIVASLLCTDVHVFYFVWQNCMCIHFGTSIFIKPSATIITKLSRTPYRASIYVRRCDLTKYYDCVHNIFTGGCDVNF